MLYIKIHDYTHTRTLNKFCVCYVNSLLVEKSKHTSSCQGFQNIRVHMYIFRGSTDAPCTKIEPDIRPLSETWAINNIVIDNAGKLLF